MNKGFTSLIILIIASVVLVGGIFGINLKNKISDTEELLENLGTQNAVGGKKYFLSGSGVSSSQATIGLTKFEIAGGSQKIRMTDFGDLGCGTIQPGNSTKQEFVSFTGVTQNSDGTATLTGVSRGLEPIPDYSASTTLRTAHAGNSTFVISNSPPCFYEGYANITQSEAVTGLWTFNTNIPTSSLTATTSQQLVNKGLLDSTTNQGAATSTETNGGIVELGTLAEQASGYDGGSAKPTVLQTKNSTSSPDVRGTYNIIAEADGYLDQDWIRTSDDFTWTGEHDFNATSSFVGIQASSTPANPLQLNGVDYAFPNSDGAASSTILSTDGSGALSWNYTDWQLLSATTTTFATSSIMISDIPTRKDLKIIVSIEGLVGGTGNIRMQFNSDSGANYGYKNFEDSILKEYASASTYVELHGVGTTSAQYLIVDIKNDASFRKFTDSSGSVSAATNQAPKLIESVGVWSNTSDQITSIYLFNSGAENFTSGSRISIYGSVK